MQREHPWQVILLGGASGVGKTMVSYRLAHHYAVGLTEVDDFQVILEDMTTPEQQPVLHYWRTHYDEARRLNEEQMLAQMLSYSRVMARALELVIANHLESRAPIVLEGDFMLPSLALQSSYHGVAAAGQVRAVFLYEEDEGQIGRNYLAREGEQQPGRAHVSWRHSEWLRREAARLGLPALSARPWETVLERVIAALEQGNESRQ